MRLQQQCKDLDGDGLDTTNLFINFKLQHVQIKIHLRPPQVNTLKQNSKLSQVWVVWWQAGPKTKLTTTLWCNHTCCVGHWDRYYAETFHTVSRFRTSHLIAIEIPLKHTTWKSLRTWKMGMYVKSLSPVRSCPCSGAVWKVLHKIINPIHPSPEDSQCE